MQGEKKMEFDFYDASSPLIFSIELIFTVRATVVISAPRLNSAKLPTAIGAPDAR